MATDLFVVVDDTDSAIRYIETGDRLWFNLPVVGDFITTTGNFGQPYNRTVSGQPSNGTLVFEFEGNFVAAYGSNVFETRDGVITPSYRCFVNDWPLPFVDPWSINGQNNQVLCGTGSIPDDGRQTIRIDVTTNSHTFFFDRLEYRPRKDADLSGKTVRVEDTHSSFVYQGEGWSVLREQARGTQVNGASVEFSFSGTALTWYGLIPSEGVPSTPAEATYQIDNEPQVPFTLYGINATTPGTPPPEQFYALFFKTPTLTQGDHIIKVVYKGDREKTPLTVDFVVVEGGPIPAILPSIVANPTGPTTSQTGASNVEARKPPVSAIMGAVVSAVVLLAGILCAVYLLRKKRRRRSTPAPYPPLTDVGCEDVEASTLAPPTNKRAVVLYDLIPTPSITRTSSKAALALPVAEAPASTSTATSSIHPSSSNQEKTDISSIPSSPPADTQAHSPATSTFPSDAPPARVVQHQDSGLRLPNAPPAPVVELPPQYTPT